MKSSQYPRPLAAFLVALLQTAAAVAAADPVDEPVEEIVVTADFRSRSVAELPVSVSVVDAAEVKQLAVQHFEELVAAVPNMNWSGDGHRARYFQLRGVGELEQYQGAPNPSVGFLIDDIDFSGIGTIATLFDVERVEVLRGPQGSRYGANALAGLVYVQSTQPGPDRDGRLQVSAGSDDLRAAGVAVGGSLRDDDRALFRISAHRHESDGFRDNRYLRRDDTNGREETTIRARLYLQPAENIDVNVALLYSDVDDGYDAFALDNSFTMLSDRPGRDAQESVGMSLRADWLRTNGLTLTSVTSVADSDIAFSFDADWGNSDSWAPFTYDYVSLNDRKRQSASQELRIASGDSATTAWVAGVYALRLDDDLLTVNQGVYFDPVFNFADSLDDSFGSAYRATSVAAFGQAERTIGAKMRLSAGARLERRTTDYEDTAGLTASPSETMAGGEISLQYEHHDALISYLSLSRGYKAGGFNLGVVPAGRREFSEEALWNLEAGVRTSWLDNALRVNAAIFVSRRDDQQVRTSFQLDPGDPASFVFFTDNAAQGETLGAELDLRWQLAESWQVYLSAGLLNASFDAFTTPQVDLSGRRQAHAPAYTFAAGANWRHAAGWFVRVDMSGKDAFYFDVSHDQKSKAYELVNLRFGYESERWSAQLWGRNVFDRRYAVRGFYFGNEPPDFPSTLYTRSGDPRQLGLTFDMRF